MCTFVVIEKKNHIISDYFPMLQEKAKRSRDAKLKLQTSHAVCETGFTQASDLFSEDSEREFKKIRFLFTVIYVCNMFFDLWCVWVPFLLIWCHLITVINLAQENAPSV